MAGTPIDPLAAEIIHFKRADPAAFVKAVEIARYRRGLSQFVRAAWKHVEPGTDLIWNWHLEAICDHLQALVKGNIQKLIVNIPPRMSKSTLASVMLPCWVWTRDPSKAFMFASYSFSLSRDHAYKRRRILDSEWYQNSFGVELASDRNNIAEIANVKGGMMFTTSLDGTNVGRGGDYLVLDDPNDPKGAESEVVRESTLQSFKLNWSTRANQPKTARWLIIQQRTHQNDVTGFCLANGGWEHLRIPMEYESSSPCETSIIVKGERWKDKRVTDGELLDEARVGRKELNSLKLTLGSYGSSGQLQQRPTPAEGGAIKKQWLRYWEPTENGLMDCGDGIKIDPFSCPRFLTVDLAASLREEADYTAIAAWCAYMVPDRPRLFMLDLTHARMEGPDITPAIKALCIRWKVGAAWIEKVGFQLALIQEARRRGIPVRELERDKDKLSRVMAATPLMEAGGFWLPARADWLGKLETELLQFPKGAHDDLVDVSGDACNLVLGTYRGSSIIPAPDTPPLNPVKAQFADLLPGDSRYRHLPSDALAPPSSPSALTPRKSFFD